MSRFDQLKAKLAAKGAYDPAALAAYIGRKKYGRAGMAALAAKGRGEGHRSIRRERISTMGAIERRFTMVVVEARADMNGKPSIGGYAAMFGRPSQNLGGFIEQVERSFFNKSRGDGWPDVMCRYNHDDNMLLGTTGAGTLKLSLDGDGLDYMVNPPSARADVLELVQRGDVRKSSFAFRLPSGGDEWGVHPDSGYPMRHLVTGALVDVAPVNTPAYLETSVGQRSLDETEIRRLGLGPDAAYESLAARYDASFDEVRSLAEENDLRRFFVRTDNRGVPAKTPAKPKLFGPAAAAELLQRRQDPYADVD